MIPFGLGAAIRLVVHAKCLSLSLSLLFELNKKIFSSLLSSLFHSTRVSNELGAGRPDTARLAVRVVVFLCIAEGVMVGLIMILVRGVWGYAYSNEEEVVKYVAVMLPILAVSHVFDGIQSVLSGKLFVLFSCQVYYVHVIFCL